MSNQITDGKSVLDPASSSRMFYFDKMDDRVLFGDIRKETHEYLDSSAKDGKRVLMVDPDLQMDFRNLPFEDETFPLVVFDPPHLVRAGKKSWLALKYGKLNANWREDLPLGFKECFRVLKPHGTLIFKWNEYQIKVSEVLELTEQKPICGNRCGRTAKSHWIVFIKPETEKQN